MAACLGPVGLAGWVRERDQVHTLARPDGFGEHMLGVSIKRFPCIGTAQAAVDCALSVYRQAQVAGSGIDSVAVQLTNSPLIVHQTSSAYARPRDRETADHSFFSLLALGLCDGDLQPAQFAARRYEDPDVLAMSDRLQFAFDLDSGERGLFSARIDARLQDGSQVSAHTRHPPGHPGNPLTTDGLLAKWRGLAQGALLPRQADDIAQWCLHGDRNTPVSALMGPLASHDRIPESTP
jgi:2-methylcitrate dehydratase PrpD